jgi:hypothetical protein
MKKAKLKQMLSDVQKAQRESSKLLKEISQKSNDAKKDLKEKKGAFGKARKEYKLARKAHREQCEKLKDARSKNLRTSKHLEKLTRKWAKLTPASKGKTPRAPKTEHKRRRTAKTKNVVIHPAAAPLQIVS